MPKVKVIKTKVVGVTKRNEDGQRRQELIEFLSSGDELFLEREPDNEYDENAIAAMIIGKNWVHKHWVHKQRTSTGTDATNGFRSKDEVCSNRFLQEEWQMAVCCLSLPKGRRGAERLEES